jgi:hypothetical protein
MADTLEYMKPTAAAPISLPPHDHVTVNILKYAIAPPVLVKMPIAPLSCLRSIMDLVLRIITHFSRAFCTDETTVPTPAPIIVVRVTRDPVSFGWNEWESSLADGMKK